MGPARFHCATLLRWQSLRKIAGRFRKLLLHFYLHFLIIYLSISANTCLVIKDFTYLHDLVMKETFFPSLKLTPSSLTTLTFLSVSVRHRPSKRIRAGAQRGSRGVAKAAYVELVPSQWKCKSAFARRPFTPTQSPFGAKLHCPLPVSFGQHVRFFGEFLTFESKYHRCLLLKIFWLVKRFFRN